MTIYPLVENFFRLHCPSSDPLLLALSGGPDSIYLFYALLEYRRCFNLPFHIAHIDHQWREESSDEALFLEQLAAQFQVPFHLKTLNPHAMKGNLEMLCREERYAFFRELNSEHHFQGIILGHHLNDKAETTFKRLLEGSHWSHWRGMQEVSERFGLRILRPLLKVSKHVILQELKNQNISYFDDPTNRQLSYLRGRFRESMFPKLSKEFGKEIQNSIIEIGQEAEELTDYFVSKINPLLSQCVIAPWGLYLDLKEKIPSHLLEIKFLIRTLAHQHQFFLSRQIIERISKGLRENESNLLVECCQRKVYIDRQRIFFILKKNLSYTEDLEQSLLQNKGVVGNWRWEISEEIFKRSNALNWNEGWKGETACFLPIQENYTIGFRSLKNRSSNLKKIKKNLGNFRVPAFLFDCFPMIFKDNLICHEFLTGRSQFSLLDGMSCWKLKLKFEEII